MPATITRSLWICLLLISCQSTPRPWAVQETKSRHLSHQAIRLFQKPKNSFREMELEFVQSSSGLRAYLNVYTLTFPSIEGDKTKTEITVCTNEEKYSFLADRLQGGQRLLLPEEAKNLLIKRLVNHHPVQITAGRFEVEIIPGEFSSLFQQKMLLHREK